MLSSMFSQGETAAICQLLPYSYLGNSFLAALHTSSQLRYGRRTERPLCAAQAQPWTVEHGVRLCLVSWLHVIVVDSVRCTYPPPATDFRLWDLSRRMAIHTIDLMPPELVPLRTPQLAGLIGRQLLRVPVIVTDWM